MPGGFYMGADYVKYTTPMATSLSLLASSLVEHKEGYKATVSRPSLASTVWCG